jgi:hypothetical protein
MGFFWKRVEIVISSSWTVIGVRIPPKKYPENSWMLVINRGGSGISGGGGVGGALKKIAPSGGRRENVWGISCEKLRFYAKKSYFFQFLDLKILLQIYFL